MTHFRHSDFPCRIYGSISFSQFEALAIVYTMMSIVILFAQHQPVRQADAAPNGMEREGNFPPVDIFICTYDEPLRILESQY